MLRRPGKVSWELGRPTWPGSLCWAHAAVPARPDLFYDRSPPLLSSAHARQLARSPSQSAFHPPPLFIARLRLLPLSAALDPRPPSTCGIRSREEEIFDALAGRRDPLSPLRLTKTRGYLIQAKHPSPFILALSRSFPFL
jgi:hypothetical protein